LGNIAKNKLSFVKLIVSMQKLNQSMLRLIMTPKRNFW
jgi:hypothetical protein